MIEKHSCDYIFIYIYIYIYIYMEVLEQVELILSNYEDINLYY